MRFNLMKSLVIFFRIWRDKEALKMECNKRNRNTNCAIFGELNLNRISNDLLNRTKSFSRTFAIDLVN